MPRKTTTPTARAVATLPEAGFVRLSTILAVFPIGRSTWWAGIRAGKYPAGVKIGANTTAWRVEDIRALLAKHADGASA